MLSEKDINELVKSLPKEQQDALNKARKGKLVSPEDEQVTSLAASIDDLTDAQLKLLKKELVSLGLWDKLKA